MEIRHRNTRTPRLGIWQEIPSPSVSRYLAAMRWDFVVLDMQHGAMSVETAYQCVHTLRAAGVLPWLRVSIGSTSEIQRALDIGAQAVVVPMVNSVEEAEAAALAAKYPPLGERSVGGDFGVHQGADYPERANQETLLLVQAEHIDAVQCIDDIMAVPGVDGCFVGPTDLALSMGLLRDGFAEKSQHREAMQLIIESILANGKMACCNSYSLPDAQGRLTENWQWLTYRSEVELLMQSGKGLLHHLRGLADESSRLPASAEAKSVAN